jgi:hypothetical protein
METLKVIWGFTIGIVAWPVIFLLCALYAIAELRLSAFHEMLERIV